MKTRYDAIIFDLFGTLVDNFEDEPCGDGWDS